MPDHDGARYLKTIEVYGRLVAIVLMLFGLREWAVILGVATSFGGSFETMTVAWKMATMYLAVADLVAAVGLWMRVAWGNVVWVCVAGSEVAFHTVFATTFGSDYTIVVFHLFALGGYATLVVLARRDQRAWPFHGR
jgi:4-amino-4-deoxy-L-arabinose transferase-like glycosyltransferase